MPDKLRQISMKFLIFALVLFLLSGCHSTGVVKAPEHSASFTRLNNSAYFDYDSDVVQNNQVIKENASWLKTNPDKVVILAGYCDERGSDEYNLLLGDRRARAVMKSLMDEGVKENQLIILSYGKKRAVSLAKNVNEKGSAAKRRVDFVLR